MGSGRGHIVARASQWSPELRDRVNLFVTTRVTATLNERRAEWARSNEGAFPTPSDCLPQVLDELEVLLRGLGQWATVKPSNVFPPRFRGYPDWDDL